MNVHTITFDKLAYLDRLKSAGISDEIARAHADGLDQALRESVATKSDLERLESAISMVEAKLEAKIDTSVERLRAETERSKNSVLMWLIPFLLTAILPSIYTALKTAGIIH